MLLLGISSIIQAGAGGSGRSPLNSTRVEPADGLHGSKPEVELHQRAHSLVEHGAEGRKPGWFQNDTYGAVSSCQACRPVADLNPSPGTSCKAHEAYA